MSATILGRTLRNAALSGLFLGCSVLAAQASPVVSQPVSTNANVTSVDRLADRDAAKDIQNAQAALAKGDRHSARDFLERADTALLNREVIDLGSTLRIDHPMPETALRQKIESAEAAMHGSAGSANGAIKGAIAAVDADMAPAHTS